MNITQKDHMISFHKNELTPSIRFLASLSDGRTVIQDNRSDQPHAWSRLSNWLKINTEIYITNLRLQGRKNFDVSMPKNQPGYFFGHKQQAVWGGPQYNYVGVGYFDDRKVNIVWYRQPNLDSSFIEERSIEKAGFFLIKKN